MDFLWCGSYSEHTMSRRNIAASITTTLQATSITTAPESSQLKMFVHSMIKQHSLAEQEITKRAIEMYGSPKHAMQAMETAKTESKTTMEQAFPNGYQNAIQVGVSDVAFSELEA
jgi:hypothetical protein